MKKFKLFLIFGMCALIMEGCDDHNSTSQPGSASGVKKADVHVQTGSDGLTVEQEHVKKRLEEDNIQGSIKHLYVISAMSGQVIIYSTVEGKVTSSGKRLNPTSVSAIAGQYNYQGDFIPVQIDGQSYRTSEVLQDDGTYGTSDQYIYWWDTKGVYHQHFISGGQIVHISSEPLVVKGIIINMEMSTKE
jgi:hypothetical protein